MTRPANTNPIESLYTISNDVDCSIGNAKTMTQVRLLLLGYSILENRCDEVLTEHGTVYRSIIYTEDIVETYNITPKSAKAILRRSKELLKGITVSINGNSYELIWELIQAPATLTIVWNQSIVQYFSERVNFTKILGL